MTPEDIIRMARSVRDGGHWSALDLINFGLFVAAAERERIKAELQSNIYSKPLYTGSEVEP
jgi:hypothetical protein